MLAALSAIVASYVVDPAPATVRLKADLSAATERQTARTHDKIRLKADAAYDTVHLARELAPTLLAARYAVFVADAEARPEERARQFDRSAAAEPDHGRADALVALTLALNGPTRCALSLLRAGGNRSGADAVATWQTGFPAAVDFARGYPRYRPLDGTAGARLVRGEVDAVLVIGSAACVPSLLLDRMAQLPCAVLGPRASESRARAGRGRHRYWRGRHSRRGPGAAHGRPAAVAPAVGGRSAGSRGARRVSPRPRDPTIGTRCGSSIPGATLEPVTRARERRPGTWRDQWQGTESRTLSHGATSDRRRNRLRPGQRCRRRGARSVHRRRPVRFRGGGRRADDRRARNGRHAGRRGHPRPRRGRRRQSGTAAAARGASGRSGACTGLRGRRDAAPVGNRRHRAEHLHDRLSLRRPRLYHGVRRRRRARHGTPVARRARRHADCRRRFLRADGKRRVPAAV